MYPARTNQRRRGTGFTLIELLVVIGIIGVISSIGLQYTVGAREAANDAEVKYQLSSARRAAEIYFDTKGDYKNSNGSTVANNCDAPHSMFIDTATGMRYYTLVSNYPTGTTLRCSAGDSGYQITASLSNPNKFWCVNAQGFSKEITAASHNAAHPNHDVDCTP